MQNIDKLCCLLQVLAIIGDEFVKRAYQDWSTQHTTTNPIEQQKERTKAIDALYRILDMQTTIKDTTIIDAMKVARDAGK